MQHYIGPKGFTIYKSSITPQQQQQIKNDLMANLLCNIKSEMK